MVGSKRNCMSTSEDSVVLVFCDEDGYNELWDFFERKKRVSVRVDSAPIRSCCVSDHGSVGYGSVDGSIGVLIKEKKITKTFEFHQAHAGQVNWCGFLNGGKVLVTCGSDKNVLAWKIPNPQPIARYITSGAICSAAAHPTENIILTGDYGGEC